MSKHTPGKWTYNALLSGSENHRGFRIYAPTRFGWSLAQVQPVDEDGVEGEANARLIAAAPQMLAALEMLHERLTKCSLDPISAAEAYDSFYQLEVLSAIAAARGNDER